MLRIRKAFLISLLISFFLFTLILFAYINHSVMGVWVINNTPLVEENDNLSSYAIFWNDKELFYDENSNEWYLPITCDNKWSGRLTISDGAGKLFLGREWKESKSKLIESGTALPVYIEKNNNLYKTAINLCGNPIISLSATECEMSEDPLDNIYQGIIRVWDNEAAEPDGLYSANARWHIKGNAAKTAEKPPYKIQLITSQGEKKELPLLGLLEDDDWILNSFYSDATLARERTIYSVWNNLAADFIYNYPSVEYRYAELIVDGEYRGVYGLCSALSRKNYNLENEDVLYKWSAPVLPWNNYAFGVLDGKEQMEWPDTVSIRWPKQWYSGVWTPLGRYSNFFLLNDGELSLEKAISITNMDNLADIVLLKQCFSLTDSTFHNMYYLYKNNDGRIYRIPWDLDASLASTDHEPFGDDLKYGFIFDYEWETLKQLDESFISDLLSYRWKEICNYFAPETVSLILMDNVKYLKNSGAWNRNWEKWNIPPLSLGLEETCAYMQDHFAFLDLYFDAKA